MEKIDKMIRIKGDIKKLLNEKKKYKRETYSDVIERLAKLEGNLK